MDERLKSHNTATSASFKTGSTRQDLEASDAAKTTKDPPLSTFLSKSHLPQTDEPYTQHNTTAASIGVPQEKSFFNLIDFLAVLVSFVCLGIAVLCVAPGIDLPTWFGYTRQLQVLGVLLTVMNKCFLILSPKFFIIMEARWGKSTLQNYDAILRNSVLGSHTSFPWRANLAIFIGLPVLLSFSYKDKIFQGGLRRSSYSNPTNISNPHYGIAGPLGLEIDHPVSEWSAIGVSYMSNATVPWFAATKNNIDSTALPPFPAAYGFNILMLSNESTAMLDVSMPDYVNALQEVLVRSADGGTINISATVHGTVTTYNNSVETHREDAAFWQYYEAGGATAQDATGPDKRGIGLLANNYHNHNASWCFSGYHPLDDGNKSSTMESRFRKNALGFDTRREICNGHWSLSRDRLQLISGSCGQQSTIPLDQSIYENEFMFDEFYFPFLNEYLARFAAGYNSSLWLPPTPSSEWDVWLVPSFATVLAGMYWSRTTAAYGYYSWDDKDPSTPPKSYTAFNKSELYYPAVDEALLYQTPILSQRSGLLYLILAIQPCLCLLIFLLGFIQYDSPFESNFGMVALLAGVWPSTLTLLKGASISGKLDRPLPLTIHTMNFDKMEFKGDLVSQVEYELGGAGGHRQNEYTAHPVFDKPTSQMLTGIKDSVMQRVATFASAGQKTSIGMGDLRGSSTAHITPFSTKERADFVTASVARLLVSSAVGEYWGEEVLSCLAACTTKLKVLSANPQKFANNSIATAEAALEELANTSKEETLIPIRLNPDDVAKDVTGLETETDGLLRRILCDRLLPEARKASASYFQIHATAYQAGVDGMPTTLGTDRLGEIYASANPFCVKNAYTALELVFKNLKAIHVRHQQSRPVQSSMSAVGTGSQGEATTIRYDWENAEPGIERWFGKLETTELDDIFSIVMPLTLSSTFASINLAPLIALGGSETNDEDPVLQFEPPPRSLGALITLSTADFDAKESSPNIRNYRAKGITPLPQSPVRFVVRAGTNKFNLDEDSLHENSPKIDEKQAQRNQEYQMDKSRMAKWVISEDSITIECHQYIYAVVFLTVFIVCGGISVPFAVRNRIAGVDPFQITLFSCILATVVIVTVKSRYAAEWPWHEFLHGQVVCRSVKEVCNASGIDAQTILMNLLLNEPDTVLRTRGPYNGMFTRQTFDPDGFKINEAVHISTMMASGFIVLQVLNVFGELLVCLNVRRGSDYISLSDTGEWLVFEDKEDYANDPATRDGDAVSDAKGERLVSSENKQVKRLARCKVRIDRILGVYIGNTCFG